MVQPKISRRLGFVGAVLLAWTTASAQAQQSVERDAKVFGKVELSPIEPVRGLFVRVGTISNCCQTLAEQETWSTPEFELDLVEAQGYRYEGIGVFVEPGGAVRDAYYLIRPTETIGFEQGEAFFLFEHRLRPVEVEFRGKGFWGQTLSIEATSTLQDARFTSYREWDFAPSDDGFQTVVWVPEGVEQWLWIQLSSPDASASAPRYGDVMLLNRRLGASEDKLVIERDPYRTVGLKVDVDGASSTWIRADVTYRAETWMKVNRGLEKQDRTYFYCSDEGEHKCPIQLGFFFEDGSSTTLASQDIDPKVGERDSSVDVQVDLTPQEVFVSMDASFDLDKLRVSVGQGTSMDDAAATREVLTLDARQGLNRKEARTTLQLPDGDWQLQGLMVNREDLLWTSNYLSWASDVEMISSPSQDAMDLGHAGTLAEVDLSVGQEESKRTYHYVVPRDGLEWQRRFSLEGTLSEPGQDARGSYTDKIYLQADQGLVVGRAGHRYRFVKKNGLGEQVSDTFEVTFGRPQKVRRGPLAFVGIPSSQQGRCDGLEVMYQGIDTGGSMTLTRLPVAPTPPRGYLVWPEKGTSAQSFDLRRHLGVRPYATARVCVQYDEERLSEDGLSAQDLSLAYPRGNQGCDWSNRDLGNGWCGVSRVDPQEMAFVLSSERGCGWYCGTARAASLSNVALLRTHPTQKPVVHCDDWDYSGPSIKGWSPIKAPEHLAAAFEQGRQEGRQAMREAWEGTNIFDSTRYERVRQTFDAYFEEAFSKEPLDPESLCILRGQAQSYARWMWFGL